MNSNDFKSVLKEEIYSFIKEKQKYGFYTKHNTLFYELRRFDNYLFENNVSSKEITKDIIVGWLNKQNCSNSSKNHYASTLRIFAIYLNRFNINAYILPYNVFERKNQFQPYIFSRDEIKKIIFTSQNYWNDELKNDRFTLIFKLLYISGMRVGECINIKIADVDFDRKRIVLKNTKNGTDRYISFNDKFKDDLLKFHIIYNQKNADSDYFFRRPYTEKKFTICDIYYIFRKILFKSKIMKTNSGPRVHDLRHTFAVHNLLKLEKENKDIYEYLPILCSYMGHSSINSTERYLRLVSEAYPLLNQKIDKDFENVIIIKDFEDEK